MFALVLSVGNALYLRFPGLGNGQSTICSRSFVCRIWIWNRIWFWPWSFPTIPMLQVEDFFNSPLSLNITIPTTPMLQRSNRLTRLCNPIKLNIQLQIWLDMVSCRYELDIVSSNIYYTSRHNTNHFIMRKADSTIESQDWQIIAARLK